MGLTILRNILGTATLSVALSASAALGQARAADNVGMGNGAASAAPGGVPQTYQPPPGAGFYNYVTDFPAYEVNVVPFARAQDAAARWQMGLRQDDLYRTVDFKREDFELSPEMRTAKDQERRSYDEFNNARNDVLRRLMTDKNYVALLSLGEDLSRQIADVKPAPGRSMSQAQMDQLMALATQKLRFATEASQMESAALEADQRAQSARARLVSAGDRIVGMRADFNRKIKRDPEFLAARRTLDNARTGFIYANAYYVAAVDARTIALNFAYYLHQWDAYNNHNGYYAEGYGGGYGGYAAPVGYGNQFGFTYRR